MADKSPAVDEPDAKGAISFSIRLTDKQREHLTKAADIRGWTLSNLIKTAAIDRASHIVNTSTLNDVDFRDLAQRVARQVFEQPQLLTIEPDGEFTTGLKAVPDLAQAALDRDSDQVAQVSPWPEGPKFLEQLRGALRYGGAEFLALVIEAAEAITARREGNLPRPIDPSDI